MAIEYIETRGSNREVNGIIDTAKSIIWHTVWFGVGDFEVYAPATEKHLNLLKVGCYVSRNNDENIGLIESVKITESIQDGKMITATGRFVKCLLDRRLIYQLSGKTNRATTVRGRVENAVRLLVLNNAINCSFDSRRNISILELGENKNILDVIVDESGEPAEKQTSYDNLLEYTDELLQEYGLSANVILNDETKKLQYIVKEGVDRSADNEAGLDPIIFSSDYDNLSDSEYLYDITNHKTVALIGGEGEDIERFYALLLPTLAVSTDLNRKEVFVDASSLNKTMKAEDLQNLFTTGVFSGIYFKVNGTIYATLVYDNDKDVSLSSLREKFPSGSVSGSKFVVSGVTYATKVYGDDDNYLLTALGYKATLDKDGEQGDYELTDNRYTIMLKAQGTQTLKTLIKSEMFTGTINVSAGNYILNTDFALGDIVTVQDNDIGKFVNVRIVEVTEVQDENGYTVDAVYE